MKAIHKVIQSTIIGVLAVTVMNSSANAVTQQKMEKCYGIVKKGMNDCQTATQTCASSSTRDSQPDAFIFLPAGTCEKIVGGNLTSKGK